MMHLQNFTFVFIFLFIASVFAQGRLSEQLGNFKSFIKGKNVVKINAENAVFELSAYSDDIIRVRIARENFRPDFSYSVIKEAGDYFRDIEEKNDRLILRTKNLQVVVNKFPVRISIYDSVGKLINSDEKRFGVSWLGTEVTCFKKLNDGERFIGLGEKTGPLDRRGNEYINWNTDDPAYETDADPLYVSIPFFIGINGESVYGIYFDNSHKSKFNFGASTDNEYYHFGAEDGEMDYYFIGSGTVREVIKDYTWLTGRITMPPLWSLGFQQCRWSYHPDSEVLRIAKTFREKKIPADVIYLDIHYMDGYRIFTWNGKEFSDPKKMIDELKSLGFHVVTIVDPGIKIDENYDKYNEGIKNNYFAKYPGGEYYTGEVWPGRCHFPDFTNPEVRDWWGNSFGALINPGVQGFWNDMNEPAAWGAAIPNFIEFDYEGQRSTLREVRNIYGLLMSRSTFEGTKKLMNGERPFILTRAAFAGIQRYSAVWTGDNEASDEHMLAGVRLINSLGLSGVPYVGPDVGGFIGDPSPELFLRWLNIGIYTPFFRNHTAFDTRQQEPWLFGDTYTDHVRELINTRYKMLPYLYSAFFQASLTGIPVARSLAVDYTADKNIYAQDNQNEFMFGDFILVAPVKSDVSIAKVYLPEGNWYRLSTNEKFEGGKQVYADCPVYDLPVFVKEGAIIPIQSVVQYSGQENDGCLRLHVYNGRKKTSTIYYEDDGKTYDYESGEYFKREMRFNPETMELILGKVEGKFKSKFKKIKLELHGFEVDIQTNEFEFKDEEIRINLGS